MRNPKNIIGETFMKGRKKNMTDIRNILHRLRQGQSKRSIHRELGVHRPIIRKLYDLAVIRGWLDSNYPMPSDEEIHNACDLKPKQKNHPLDSYRSQIEQWHNKGMSSVVMYQLLKDNCSCSDQSIRRYRNKYFPKKVEPVMVRSTTPGLDMEVDFGELGRFVDENGLLKKVWILSLRLRHSRRAYREIALDQSVSTFLMGHVRAFEYFSGVPEKLHLDNLKAGVIRSTVDNDMINRSYQALAEHYGFIISPCLPRTPQHKGGVEGDIKYAKKNFIPYFRARQKQIGIDIPKICDLSEALEIWGNEIADLHIVYGVGRSPLEIFNSEEKRMLHPLPKNRWEIAIWGKCEVRKDWRIMMDSAYYSVPYQLIGEMVETCTTNFLVRIFHKNKEVTLHELAKKKWEYKRKAEHAPPFHEAILQCSREGILLLAKDIGSFTYQVVETILSHPSVDKLKPTRHLLGLSEKYSKERLENACKRAFECKLFSYSSVKNILSKGLDSQPTETSNKNKIIPLATYKYARNPEDYKSAFTEENPKTFEEKIEEQHSFSKHGNAMLGGINAMLCDEIIDEAKMSHPEKE